MNYSEIPFQIEISQEFAKVYPGAAVGILVLEKVMPQSGSSNLVSARNELIRVLQKQFPDLASLKAEPVIQVYTRYYRKFDKSYHVLGQLRSVIFENRSLPSSAPLVDAIFAVELKNMLLTAIHDLETISFPLKIGISVNEETYITLGGEEKRLKFADMMVSDQTGVISSVIYGPDERTRVTPSTSRILIVVYAPDGISRESIFSHFKDLENLIGRISPDCKITLRSVFPPG